MYTTQLATGLILATEEPWQPREEAETTIAMGTMLAAPTAKDLELGADTIDDAIALVSGIPFGPAMFMASAIAAQLHHHARDIEWQLDLARQMLPPAVVRRIEEFVRDAPTGHVVFDARFVHALQRVLIVHAAADATPRDLDDGEVEQIAGALFALAADLPAAVPPDQDLDHPNWRGWTDFFTQSTSWYGNAYIIDALGRAYAMFAEIPASPELQEHPARSEVDRCMTETYGMTLSEQLAAGLATMVASKAGDPEISTAYRPILERGFLGDAALADRLDDVLGILSATREELQGELVRVGETPEKIAWDHSALEARPLIALSDGRLLLTSPRSLFAWLTRGMHYRLLDAAGHRLEGEAAKKSRGLFLTYTGALGEEYVRRLVGASLKDAEEAGAVRLLPEIDYRIGTRSIKSPDVALDAGPDLILFEVYSGRMGIPARTGADLEALSRFVDRATGDKLVELADRTRELLAGQLVYDGVNLPEVRRVFPIVVLAGDPLIQHPLLWGHLRADFPSGWVDDARVQEPLLFDLDDLEAFLTLAEQGHHLPDLLAMFLASDAVENPPSSWVTRTFDLERRPTYVDERARSAIRAAHQILYPNSDRWKEVTN
jgi:hypothetical protein